MTFDEIKRRIIGTKEHRVMWCARCNAPVRSIDAIKETRDGAMVTVSCHSQTRRREFTAIHSCIEDGTPYVWFVGSVPPTKVARSWVGDAEVSAHIDVENRVVKFTASLYGVSVGIDALTVQALLMLGSAEASTEEEETEDMTSDKYKSAGQTTPNDVAEQFVPDAPTPTQPYAPPLHRPNHQPGGGGAADSPGSVK